MPELEWSERVAGQGVESKCTYSLIQLYMRESG